MPRRVAGLAAVCAVCALSMRTALPFVSTGRSFAPRASLDLASEAKTAPLSGASRAAPSSGLATAMLGGCAAAAVALGASRRAAGRRAAKVVRMAEEGAMDSLIGRFMADDEEASEEAARIEEENKQIEEEMSLELTGNDAQVEAEEETDDVASKRGRSQVAYNLYPSRQYVLYIAKQNAQRNWTKDGPGGKNIGCIEVQIAIFTERIRSMVLHCREFNHDFKCRLKLVSLVSRRRRLLDKLAVKDLESYLKVREELKIRHVYRMEALIGRLPAYRYTIRDRKQAPGRKVAMRLKKTKKMLNRRLANQLRQGKSPMELHKTRKQIKSRKWLTRSYDEVNALLNGKEPTEYVDPLNMP